jgi:RNA polymerase sigma-70 factor, ECF subfamily
MLCSDVPQLTDRELVELAGKGELSAYGCLYDRYINQVYRFVYFRVTNQEEAEDLSELVFTKTFELIQRDYQKIDFFKGWIFRTAQNLVIDHYRLRKNQVSLENAYELPDRMPSPENTILNEEDMQRLQKMIGQLEDIYQQIIIYRFINEMSYEEVAQIMGLKQSNLRVIQSRALQKLRNLYQKQEELQ